MLQELYLQLFVENILNVQSRHKKYDINTFNNNNNNYLNIKIILLYSVIYIILTTIIY
jgi:hypothetical protein